MPGLRPPRRLHLCRSSAWVGISDYFGLFTLSPEGIDSDLRSGDRDEDDGAPGDPYLLPRQFKDDLLSPDAHWRQRTLSTLSTLSGGPSYISSEHGENELSFGRDDGWPGLGRSSSMSIRQVSMSMSRGCRPPPSYFLRSTWRRCRQSGDRYEI